MSRRGYTLNARTEKRKTFQAKVIAVLDSPPLAS